MLFILISFKSTDLFLKLSIESVKLEKVLDVLRNNLLEIENGFVVSLALENGQSENQLFIGGLLLAASMLFSEKKLVYQ